MNIEFKKSFARDLKKKAKDANLRLRVQEIIQQLDDTDRMDEIRNLKKLRAEGNYSSFAPFSKGLQLTIIFSFYFFIVVKGS